MNVVIKSFFNNCARFFADRKKRWLFFAGVLALAACADFFISGLARRTFVFYSIGSGEVSVEDRMIRRSPFRERNVRRYVEEAVLGSILPGMLPLFPRGTRLRSLLLRDGTAYVDFSEEAVFAPSEGGDVLDSFRTLHEGIRRNFPFVGDVRFFIMGKSAYSDEFRYLSVEQKNQASGP